MSVLLSSLTKMEYEKPVNSIQDVLDNNYKFLVAGGTRILEALKKDPREQIKTAMQNHLVVYPFRGVHPPWVIEMWESLFQWYKTVNKGMQENLYQGEEQIRNFMCS